jgi:hypothetical protein
VAVVSPKTAAICKSGHVVSMDVIDPANRVAGGVITQVFSPDIPSGGRQSGSTLPRFCGKCGLPVLTTCSACGSPISNHNLNAGEREPLSFCTGCGIPQPWATREERILRLIGLLDSEEGLGEAERLEAVEAIEVLSQPEDEGESAEERIRAGERFKELAPKAWRAAAPILTALLTAEAKTRLGLPPG